MSRVFFTVAIALLLTACAGSCAMPTDQDDDVAGAPLWDGATLDGWRGDPALWRVEDGTIVGETDGTLARNSFLIYDGDFTDFTLTLDFKLRNHNSGVQFRSHDLDADFHVGGPQADIADDSVMASLSLEPGGTVDATDASAFVHAGAWNHYRINASGAHITLALNDHVTIDDADGIPNAPLHGFFALQLHTGDAMKVQFKNIALSGP
ncbi:MAG TPA: DUF1080 domain-containing protein [Myxococcota bacterium]|jgi:hypothetical protein